MKKLLISIAFLGAFAGLSAQQAAETALTADDQALAGLRRLTMPAGYATRPLLYKKDNTRQNFFSGIYSQDVWNCNQASSIWTMFTYEINYLRNLSAKEPANQYSPMAVYNYLNYANPTQGVSYFDSWNLVKANGIAANPDFSAYSQNSTIWMDGYDKYYRGMKNRIDEVFAIDVATPEGLLTLKHWINDHLDGSQIGGLANFQIGSGDMIIPQIPLDKGLEEEGQYIVIKYGPYVGHAMTFAGWNDSVRYDVNGDGRYTNNIDINGDGTVNMKDWEIGAMLVVNSWSAGWGNAGKVWVMYRLLAEKTENGGIWNNAAMVVKPKKTYNPLLTIKISIRYNQRNRIKIQAGVAADPNATVPDRTIDFPCFNFQGDTLPMKGYTGATTDELEIGLDITPLMNYLSPTGQGRIFLEVVQKSPNSMATGSVQAFSVMNYTGGTVEVPCPSTNVPIARNALTRLSVPVQVKLQRPFILNESLPDAQVGVEYRNQLEADGTAGPFRYANPATWFVESPEAPSVAFTGGSAVFTQPGITSRVMDLPFEFPFYGRNYNQVTILSDGGIVMGPKLVVYPYVIDNRLRFFQNTGVFPFLTNLYYPDAAHSVTFEASASEAIIRWHATTDPEGKIHVEFAAKLLPDGKVQLCYGNMATTSDMAWISGISEGDNLNYHLLGHNFTGIVKNTAFSLSHLAWPAWLSLGDNGDMHGTPDKPGVYTLPIRLTDGSGISNTLEMTLTVTGGNGVETAKLTSSVALFPNPSSGKVWLTGVAVSPGKVRMVVHGIDGSLVLTREYAVGAGSVTLEVNDTETLPAGIYLVRLSGALEGSGKFIRR